MSRIVALASLSFAAVSVFGSALPSPARAEDPKAPAVAVVSGVTGPGCVVKGAYPAPKGLAIFDAPSGGRAVATFTGAAQPMVLTDFPADPRAGRARVATSLGAGVRLDGFVAPATIPLFTQRDVAVVPGHVWISEAQRVKPVQAASGSLTVEVEIPGTSAQVARAVVPCDALGLAHGQPAPATIPGNGRGYLSKGAVELFDEPGGTGLFTLRSLDVAAQLFWSTESRAGFVHLRGRGALTLDAWARASSVEALKQGEMMDQFGPPTTAIAAAQLSLDRQPRVATASHAIAIHARRDDKAAPIGTIEPGAEVYVMETMLGWVNVLPKNLGLAPADDGGFWVPSADLP